MIKQGSEKESGEVLDDMVMEQITVALQIQIGAYAEYN